MSGRRHGAARRWSVVVLLVGVLAALPALIGALPASDAAVAAAALRQRALDSADVPFSGYAESAGGLLLPVTEGLPPVAAQLTSVADLFSDRTTMRVWWRGAEDDRVDVVTSGGETDVHRDPAGTWTWDYAHRTVTRTLTAPIALPTAPDLVPSALGRRLLSEAAPEELSRIGARRIAGRDALGLRVRPTAAASSVGQLDVWVDRATGLPLQVEVFGKGLTQSSLDTRFLDLDLTRPAAAVTAFTPPPGAQVETGGTDLLRLAAQFLRRVRLPEELAGLPRRPSSGTGTTAGIALYGRGVTLLAVAPVPRRVASAMRGLLTAATGAVSDDIGIRAATGPLSLMLVDPPGGGPYLLTGTVTLDALASAAQRLPTLGPRP